ncbi:GNAT family N-acetyltransferase [Sphingomonas sp.]|uniref:GNAT family N-acetyltransferase n=1 Tax=Sphingomonas sp. TaxID=28214 RepID=UPI002DEC10F0|nr:GNAT family N-acetyltransferase [Sphingomonas sp.]
MVRHLRDGDLPALQTIRAAAFAPIFASFRELVGAEIAGAALKSAEAEQSALLETLCQPEPCRRVLVAALDSGPVGFCSARVEPEQRLGEIELNAVHPDHAGLGIGSRLIGAALQWLKNQGAEVATVGTGADPSHAAARRAYQKVGFGPAIPSIYLYKRL